MQKPSVTVSSEDIANGHVLCWRLWHQLTKHPEYDVVIPSHARPDDLCLSTLTLLQKHGVNMCRVHIFVDFAYRNESGVCAYEWYVQTLRRHGFHAVHVRPGGAGLEGNMSAIRKLFDIGTYLITMSDKVYDVLEVMPGNKEAAVLKPIPMGALPALWHHGYDVLKAGEFAAWSTNATHSARTMIANHISRRAGLLDGNMTGQMVTQSFKDLTIDYGLIYDVEYAAALWHSGQRYVRYRGLCCKHPYRSKGGQTVNFKDAEARRRAENSAIKTIAAKYPAVIQFAPKPFASLKVMQYSFRSVGPGVLKVKSRSGHGQGRNRRFLLNRPATPQERKAAERLRKKKQRDRQ